jgi:hypothetical protein
MLPARSVARAAGVTRIAIIAATRRGAIGWSKSHADDPELELLVFGNRHKLKRSELVKTYDLGGLSDERIISVAQKEMAADQRLREAKEAADQQRSRSRDRPPCAAEGRIRQNKPIW